MDQSEMQGVLDEETDIYTTAVRAEVDAIVKEGRARGYEILLFAKTVDGEVEYELHLIGIDNEDEDDAVETDEDKANREADEAAAKKAEAAAKQAAAKAAKDQKPAPGSDLL